MLLVSAAFWWMHLRCAHFSAVLMCVSCRGDLLSDEARNRSHSVDIDDVSHDLSGPWGTVFWTSAMYHYSNETIVMRQFCLSVTITVQKRQTVLLRAIYWTHRLFALGMHFFQESCKKTAHISSRDTGTLSAVTIDILIITFIYSKYYFYIFKILLLYIQKH